MGTQYNLNMNSDDFDLKIETLKNSVIEDHLSDYVISIKDDEPVFEEFLDLLSMKQAASTATSNEST